MRGLVRECVAHPTTALMAGGALLVIGAPVLAVALLLVQAAVR